MSSHKSRLIEFLKVAQARQQALLIGPLATSTPPAQLLQASAVMCIDGGIDMMDPSEIHYSIGDGDSAKNGRTLDEQLPVGKDTSDLAMGLQHLPAGLKTIHLWGFWGGRFDHQLCNLGEIQQFLQTHTAQIFLHNPEGAPMLALPQGEHSLDLIGTFTLLSLQTCHFTIGGECRYPLATPTRVLPLSAHTLSNIGAGKVTITCDHAFFCYLAPEEL